jgi:pyruvate dehydrogenase E2 component (dihydrolipoamide acetyltransferase)
MKDFKIPELGENIKSALVVKVLVKVGDMVETDQPVLEVETDKATIEIPSDVNGKVTVVNVNEGDNITIGQVIFSVESTENIAPVEVTAPEKETVATATDEKAIEPVVQEELKPEVAEPAKPEAPVITTEAPKTIIPVENQPPILLNSAPAAPSVRRLAREIGVDVNQIKGTGVGGRILLDDVKAYSKVLHQQQGEMQHIRVEQHQEPLPDFTKFGEVERQSMSNIRYKTLNI